MTKIIINGAGKAILAGSWAEEHFPDGWKIELLDTFSDNFVFKFNNARDAEFFALKWI